MDLLQVKDKLVALKGLLEAGLITELDFDREKNFLLGSYTGSTGTSSAQTTTDSCNDSSTVLAPKSDLGNLQVSVDRCDTILMKEFLPKKGCLRSHLAASTAEC